MTVNLLNKILLSSNYSFYHRCLELNIEKGQSVLQTTFPHPAQKYPLSKCLLWEFSIKKGTDLGAKLSLRLS